MAGLLRDKCSFAEAEPLYQGAANGFEAQLGPNHPRTLLCLVGLAGVLEKQGKTDEAEELLRKVLKRKEDHLGASHPKTLLSVRKLASLLKVKQFFAEAGELYLRELRGLEELHDPNHEMIQRCQRNLERVQQAHRLQTAAAMDVLPANQTIAEGMRCRYWFFFILGGRWLPACVTKVHGDGTVDLDIKKHASIDNISPSPEVAEAEAWPPGTSVSYNSSTAKRWIPAVVQSFNSMSSTNPVGSYNLDVRPMADCEKIRPRLLKPEVLHFTG